MSLSLCGSVGLASESAGAVPLPAKCLGLLAYLALEPGPHSREALRSLLWGDSADDRANTSLRQALSRLRAAVGDDLLVERTTVELNKGFPTDVARFLLLAETGHESALDIDIPRFLAGLPFRDAPSFEEWTERTRSTLLRRWRVVLVNTARSAAARREWQRAMYLGDRWQALDLLSDDAAHFRVETRFLAGDRDGALATWREYRKRRQSDTGNEPSLALRELAARIETSPSVIAAPLQRSAISKEALPPFETELVGRAKEWETLLRALQDASNGASRVVLIDGEPGTGRTRLLDDFLRLAATRGATVLRGRSYGAGLDVPFGPMRDVLREAVEAPGVAGTDERWLAEVARVVPEMRKHFSSLPDIAADPSAERSLLHEGVVQLMLAAAEEATIVVALDDVQWADGDSCHLLHHLVRRLEGAPVLWCSSFSLGTVARDAPAARLVRALGALPTARRVHLAPFSRDDVWALIRALGRVQQPEGGARLATRVHELTDGNVLYVFELLKSLFTRGWLAAHPETGEWMTTAAGGDVIETGDMYPSLREGIAERVAALPDDEHALLLTVAASGRGCHTSLLSYVHGISRLRAAHTCDALVERHLVMEAEGSYRCTNTLIASVVLDSVGASRRRETHRMIALALTEAAASIRRSADPGAIARHAEAGGEGAMAYRHALLASEQCTSQGAWDDALAWLDLAATCAETTAESDAVNEATAAVMHRVGGNMTAAPRAANRSSSPSIGSGDVDLAAISAFS